MAELHVRKQNDLKNQAEPFSKFSNYQKIIRFADEELKNTLAGYNAHIKTRNENTRRDSILSDAKDRMESNSIRGYMNAMELLKTIPGWKDADEQLEICQKNIDALKAAQEAKRVEREQQAKAARTEIRKKIDARKAAKEAKRAEREQQTKAARTERRKSKRGLKIIATMLAVILVIGACAAVLALKTPLFQYLNAVVLAKTEQYEAAISAFEELDGFWDSKEYIAECKAADLEHRYATAIALMDSGKYEEAISMFQRLGTYRKSVQMLDNCQYSLRKEKYDAAAALQKPGKYLEAMAAYAELLDRSYTSEIRACLESIPNPLEYRKELGQVAITLYQRYAQFGKEYGMYVEFKDMSLEIWDAIAVRDTTATSYNYSVALKNNGTVVAAGSNRSPVDGSYISPNGPCDVHGWHDIVAVAAGSDHTVGLKADGTVVATGRNDYGQCEVSDWTGIVSIAAGEWFTLGLKADGTVVCAGVHNSLRDVGSIVSLWKDIVAIAAGVNNAVGLQADGTVVGTFDISSDCTDIIGIDVGHARGRPFFVGVKEDRSIVVSSSDAETLHALQAVTQWKNIVDVQTAYGRVVGIQMDHTVVSVTIPSEHEWFESLELNNWKDIVALSPGYEFIVGLKSDGTMVAAGKNVSKQCNVTGWRDIKMPQ